MNLAYPPLWEARGTLVSAPPHKTPMEANVGTTFRRIAVCEPSPYMSEAECKANAALIVRAVNSHEELLAACKRAVAALTMPSLNLTDEAIAQLGSAIAKAEAN